MCAATLNVLWFASEVSSVASSQGLSHLFLWAIRLSLSRTF